MIENRDKLGVQTDARQCALGKFLYGDALEEIRRRNPELASAIDEIKTPHQHLHESAVQIEKMLQEGGYADAFELFKKLAIPAFTNVQSIIAVVAESAQKAEIELEHQQITAGKVQKQVTWLGMILGAVLSVLLGFGITRAIVKPLNKAVTLAGDISIGDLSQRMNYRSEDELGSLAQSLDNMASSLEQKAELAQKIAQGDLTSRITIASEKDVLGKALQLMISNLNEVLGDVNNAAVQIAAGTSQVSDSSQSLSQGATEQAASLEEITSSVTELAGQTKANSENATQANRLAMEARQTAETGNSRMQGMVTAMSDISHSSKEIAKIIKTIDDIAFQTNLLALNAAVEAARAGRHGKGFAVVAQEVRNLAHRSAKAAQETTTLIEGAVKNVENGTLILNQTAEALNEIVTRAKNVANLVEEIATASSEQAQGISQINQGLAQVDQVTQANTANAEETASAAEELSSQAAQMQVLVSRFKLNIR
jgi:methyl-accepting chemotaxis protein